jgi:O-antigen ligase
VNNFVLKARVITLGSAVVFLPFSVRFCHLSLVLFLIVSLFEGDFINRGRRIAQNPLGWLLPLFFLLHVVGVFYSEDVANAWTNVDKKIAFVLAPLIIVSAKPFTKKEINWLMWAFVGACLIGTFVCLYATNFAVEPVWNLGPKEPYEALHPGTEWWAYLSYIHLASGIDMHPTYLSLYLLVCILIVVKTIENRWISTALIVYFLVFIVFLSSRIVILSTALTIIGIAIGNSRRGLMVACAVVMLTAIILNPVSLYRNAQEYTRSNLALPPAAMSDNPITIRMSLLWLSAQAIPETNPLLGTGTGDVERTLAALQEKYNVHNVLHTSDPHNQYLHTYIALGAVGLLLLFAVFLTPMWILFRQKEFLACAGLMAFMLISLTESMLELQKGIVLFTLCVSLAGNQLKDFRFSFYNASLADPTDQNVKSVRSV